MTITPKQLAIGAAVALVAIVIWFAIQPEKVSPEVAIGRLVDQALDSAAAGDVDGVMDTISDTFHGQAGASKPVGADQLRAFLAMYMLRGGITVQELSREIEVSGDGTEGTVRLTVVVGKGGFKGAMAGDMGARDLELGVMLEGDEWKVVASRHRSTTGGY